MVYINKEIAKKTGYCAHVRLQDDAVIHLATYR